MWYHSKPRKFTYKKVWIIVYPTVFSPIHTLSTKILLEFISNLNLIDSNVLELGCGSGIISIYSASKGAVVLASDINEKAINGINEAALEQNLKIQTIYSNLFDKIPKQDFDFIFINPPYYPRNAKNITERAWFCGEDFKYFVDLFRQLPQYMSTNTNVYMNLSEDCEIELIKSLALQQNLIFKLIHEVKKNFERTFIFKLEFN